MEKLAAAFAVTLGRYVSKEAVVFIISMVPILELRGGLIVSKLLFGIKGYRWEEHYPTKIASFFNDAWIRPLAEETPRNAGTVEKKCYW